MLSPQAITTAAAQVASLEARGFVVQPLSGTMVDGLVKTCHIPLDQLSMPAEDGTHTLYLDTIQMFANSSDDITGACEHTLSQEELAGAIAEKVIGYLAQTKTQVAPMVEEFASHVMEAVAQMSGNIPYDFEICTYGMPAPLADESIMGSIKKAEHITMDKFELPFMALGAIAPGALVELVKTGQTGTDAAITDWVNSRGENFLQQVWDQTFAASTLRAVTDDVYFADTEEGNDNLLAVFLMCRNLLDNPLEGTTMSLHAFNARVHDLRTQVATRINARLESYERSVKNGALVLSSFQRKIVVNEAAYIKWLKDGGSNDVLFGNALSSNPSSTAEEIDKNADASKAAWKSYLALQKVDHENRMFTRMKELAEIEFSRLLAAASHDEIPLNERENICQRFKEQLTMTRTDELKNVYCWALRLVAKSVFWKKDAYRILKDICDIREANPELDPAQAGAIAAINYIAYWVSMQMQLVRV